MTDHCIPGIERPACFEIVPTARAVSGAGKKRRSRFVTRQSIRTAFATVARENAWSMRTVLNSASRADSERSPLHDVKQHTHPRRTQGGRGSVSLLDEQNRLPATGRRLVLSQALTQRLLRQQSLMLEQAETDAGLKVVETAGNHARQTPSQSSRVADLVEPDGIEPTTSCLQSRRYPN